MLIVFFGKENNKDKQVRNNDATDGIRLLHCLLHMVLRQ